MISQNYMQSVETLVQYSRGDMTEQEAPHDIPDRKPAPEWPANGAIDFQDVKMRYRPGLPFVLKGFSMSIRGGEKIGVVGRCDYICSFVCYLGSQLNKPVVEPALARAL